MGIGIAGQRRIRVGAPVATALLGFGFVTGCGTEDTDPNTNTQPTNEDQQQNEQQQPGSKQPDEPAEPEEYTFVKQYIDAINQVQKGGDTNQLLSMGTDDCEGCTYMADYHTSMYEDGGKYVGDPSWTEVRLIDGPTGNDPVVLRIEALEPAVELIEKKGQAPQNLDEARKLTDFELVNQGGTWKVSNFCGVTEGQPLGCTF